MNKVVGIPRRAGQLLPPATLDLLSFPFIINVYWFHLVFMRYCRDLKFYIAVNFTRTFRSARISQLWRTGAASLAPLSSLRLKPQSAWQTGISALHKAAMKISHIHASQNIYSRLDHPGSGGRGVTSMMSSDRRFFKGVTPSFPFSLLLTMILGLILGSATVSASVDHAPRSAENIHRELMIPSDALDLLINTSSEFMMLPRSEYEELLHQALQEVPPGAPGNSLIVAADYQARATADQVIISGTLAVDVLADGWQVLSLPFQGGGLQVAQLDDSGATLARDGDRGYLLLINGRGRRQLRVVYHVPIIMTATEQNFTCEIATPPASSMRLTATGNVALKTGAVILSSGYNEKENRSQFELLPPSGNHTYSLVENQPGSDGDGAMTAFTIARISVTETTEYLAAVYTFDLRRQKPGTIRLQLPPHCDIADVQSNEVTHWEIAPDGDKRVLTLTLREAISDQVRVQLTATSQIDDLGSWQYQPLQPRDTRLITGLYSVSLAAGWQTSSMTTTGLTEVNTAIYNQAAQKAGLTPNDGEQQQRRLGCFYARDSAFILSGKFTSVPGSITANSVLNITVDESRIEGLYTTTVTAAAEALFSLSLSLPTDWQVTEIRDHRQQTVDFAINRTANERSQVTIPCQPALVPGEHRSFFIKALHVPPQWYDRWTSRALKITPFALENARREEGRLFINESEDFTLHPQAIHGLRLLTPHESAFSPMPGTGAGLAYAFDQNDYQAEVKVTRNPLRLSATVYSFYQIDPELLSADYELVFQADNARTRELRVTLPIKNPNDLSIRGLEGVEVKEYTAAADGNATTWTIHLSDRRRGEIRLAMEYRQTVTPEELQHLILPVLVTGGTEFQTGYIVVEGSPELDIAIYDTPRPVDIGEMAEARHQAGQRVLGTFSHAGPPPPVRIEANRLPKRDLPTAIVQNVTLDSMLSRQGESVTSLHFQIRTRGLLLEVAMPEAMTLWSVLVDGVPLKAANQHGRILLALPENQGDRLRDLNLLYARSGKNWRSWHQLSLTKPRLFLYHPDLSQRQDIPVLINQWQLYFPAEFRVVSSSTHEFTGAAVGRDLPLLRLLDILYEASGKIGRFGVLPLAQRRIRPGHLQVESRLETVAGDVRMASPPESKAKAELPAREDRSRSMTGSLEGTRGLFIEMTTPNRKPMIFHDLGSGNELRVVLIDRDRAQAAGSVLGMMALLYGLISWRRPGTWKTRYLLGLFAATTILPLIPAVQELAVLFTPSGYAAILLTVLYLVPAITPRWLIKLCATPMRPRKVASAALLMIGYVLATALVSASEPVDASFSDDDAPAPPAIEIPQDVFILPYDGEIPGDQDKSGNLIMIPYAHYLTLQEKIAARSSGGDKLPAVPYALAGAHYTMTLSTDNYLRLEGRITIETFSERQVAVPLSLPGGILEKAEVDGQPARLAGENSREHAGEFHHDPENHKTGVSLYLAGSRRHQLHLLIRLPVTSSQGWRACEGRLPAAPATELSVTIPWAGTEVKFNHAYPAYLEPTTRDDTTISTVVGEQGLIHLQWRPRAVASVVDRSLSVLTHGDFDLSESGLRLKWKIEFENRRDNRPSLAVAIPSGYEVEKVLGDQVRSWSITSDNEMNILETRFTTFTDARASFTIYLWKKWQTGQDAAQTMEVPYLTVPDAIRQTGAVTLRHSPAIELQITGADGVRQIERDESTSEIQDLTDLTVSPFPLKTYKEFEFKQIPFRIVLQSIPVVAAAAVNTQTILSLFSSERRVESKMSVSVTARALYHLAIQVPADFTLDNLQTTGRYAFSMSPDGRNNVIRIDWIDGVDNRFDIYLQGRLPQTESASSYPIPAITVLQAEKQEGVIAILTDPDVQPAARNLTRLEAVKLHEAQEWLQGVRRQLAQLAVRYRQPDYAGEITLTARTPAVTATSITNIRVTDRIFQETILIDFNIQTAGINTFEFTLPATWAEARLSVPFLLKKTVSPDPANDQVRFVIELQEKVRKQLRVLLESERLVSAEKQQGSIPLIKTGTTNYQYMALENASRDELVVEKSVGFSLLAREQNEWRSLQQFVGQDAGEVYVLRAAAGSAEFAYQLRPRQEVVTVGARINLAQAQLYQAANGVFHGRQTYYVDNRTEQFLKVTLPPAAELWSVTVANQPVKPIVADARKPRQIAIPLVKTAPGDLNYTVILKYGGQLAAWKLLPAVDFPLITATSINIEQSQVELFLPREYIWPKFTSAMRNVTAQGVLESEYYAYKSRMAEGLVETLSFGSSFSKARALTNLDVVEAEIAAAQEQLGADSPAASPELQQARDKVKNIKENLNAARPAEAAADRAGNRRNLYDNYARQEAVLTQTGWVDHAANWRALNEPSPAPSSKGDASLQAGLDDAGGKIVRDETRNPTPPQQFASTPALADAKERKTARSEKIGKDGGYEDLAKQYQARLQKKSLAPQPLVEEGYTQNTEADADDKLAVTGAKIATGLVSLDVELPRPVGINWTRYEFTTPRGDIAITGHGLSRQVLRAFAWTMAGLALALIVWYLPRWMATCRLWDRLKPKLSAPVLCLAGMIALILGIFPVLAILLILWGIVKGCISLTRKILASLP